MLLIIDNYDSFTYNLYQSIAPFYNNIQIVRNNKISLQQIKKLNPKGIILSPGPKRPEDAGICIDIIRDTQDIPLLGVCLGHQAIAAAFGGKVIHANEVVHGKRDLILHQKSGLFKNMPVSFQAGRYHSLMVERESLPEVLQIEAENSQNIIMGLKHKTLPIYGVQFHPESILTPEGSQLLEEFVKLCL